MKRTPALTEAEVNVRIQQWHRRDGSGYLHEFLGWTREEYTRWVKSDEIPKRPATQSKQAERARQ